MTTDSDTRDHARSISREKGVFAFVVAKQAGFSLVIRIVGLALTYLVLFQITKLGGPELYGKYSFAMAVTQILLPFVFLGVGRGLIKFLPGLLTASSTVGVNTVVTGASVVSALGALLVGGGLYVGSDAVAEHIFSNSGAGDVCRLVALLFLPVAMLRVWKCVCTGLKNPAFGELGSEVVARGILVAGLLAGLFFGIDSVQSVLFWFALGNAVGLFFLWVGVKRVLDVQLSKSRGFDRPLFRRFFRYSLALLLVGSLGKLHSHVDALLIAKYLDFTALGVYKVATKVCALAGLVASVFLPIASTFFAEFSAEKDLAALRACSRTVLRWMYMAAFPVGGVLFWYSDTVMGLAIGQEHQAEGV